jgi:sugar phosphate isomerase/epimerase
VSIAENLGDQAVKSGLPEVIPGHLEAAFVDVKRRQVAAGLAQCQATSLTLFVDLQSDLAAAHGVGLSLKPHGGQNATGPQCRQAIERVGHPNFRLWYDPGNIFYYSQGNRDPVDDSATVDGLVVGMSVKDFRPPKDVTLTLGTG